MTPRNRLAVFAALLCPLILAGCGSGGRISFPWLGLSVRLPGSTSAPASLQAAQPEEAPAPSPSGAQLTIAEFVPIAEAFVTAHRGLAFKSPVQVTLLDDATFKQRLLDKLNTTPGNQQSLQTTSRDLLALHLISSGVDLGSSTRDLLGAGVSGFYEPSSKSLVVRGVAATPYVREVIVHELTHALQDQWFGIDRPQLDTADDERAIAFQTVVEGDAVRIQNEYHASMSPQDQFESNREQAAQGGGVPASVPSVLVDLVAFPYVVGPRFIATLMQVGGQPKVDDAFVHPPVSTAQILEASRYLAGQNPIAVSRPTADGTVYDHGVLGEFGLLLALENVAGLGNAGAAQAAATWGGDEYVAWLNGSKPCLRVAVVATTPDRQASLDSALQSFAKNASGTFSDASGSGPAVLTTCA